MKALKVFKYLKPVKKTLLWWDKFKVHKAFIKEWKGVYVLTDKGKYQSEIWLYFKKQFQDNLKEKIKNQTLDNIFYKMYKWAKTKQKYQNRKDQAMDFFENEYQQWFSDEGEIAPFKYKYQFTYEIFLKYYGYKMGFLFKTWREYRRLKKSLEMAFDSFHFKWLKALQAAYEEEIFLYQKQMRAEFKRIEKLAKEWSRLKAQLAKFFISENEEKFDNDWFVNYGQPANMNMQELYFMQKQAIKTGKLFYNTNQVGKGIEDFMDWTKTLTDQERAWLQDEIYRQNGAWITFANDGWIEKGAWIPMFKVRQPLRFQYVDNYNHTANIFKFYNTYHLVNSNTRGFMHVKARRPSKRNPSGKYTWWNIRLAVWKKIGKAKTTAAFEKYFYDKNRRNMMYLLPNSIYWRKKRPRKKTPLLPYKQ